MASARATRRWRSPPAGSYTQGQRGSRHYVAAVDVNTGAKVWETVAGGTFNESRGNGPRGTPTVDGARLYTLSPDGTLACLEAASGKMIWSQNVLQKFRGSVPSWGISESPLIDGESRDRHARRTRRIARRAQ